MKTRRYVLTLLGFVILPLLLFQFQNCAPSQAVPPAAAGGEVGLPESVGKVQLQFASQLVEVQDDAVATDVDGFCNQDHEGAKVSWEILADQDASQALISGNTVCHAGQFVIEVQKMNQVVCGVSLMLVAEGDWGASNFATFIRRCQALASQAISPPADSPEGTTCALEYSPASEAEQQCAQVCYRDGKVVTQATLQVGQCSTLAASLAGP